MKALLWLLISSVAFGQDLQNRSIIHLQAGISSNWYVPVWSITNLRSQTPDNTNLFSGLGYRGKDWWLEGMVQKQWNVNGGFLAADFRFSKKFGRQGKTLLYFEPEAYLTQKTFYWFLYGETEVWKKFSVGAETENANRPGPDMTLVGPRISRPLGRLAGFDVSSAVSFRFDPLEHPGAVTGHPHEVRLYLVFNRRFAKGGRN